MSRTRFHQGLDELKQKLLAMGGMAEQAVERAVRAFQTHDLALCERVLRDEAQINATEREVDELSLDLLAMQQPMAVDLRFIVSCIKINSDLERVGDQAVNIAQRVLEMPEHSQMAVQADIPKMASLATAMVHDALNAFVTADPGLARSVLRSDDLVDNLNREIFSVAESTIGRSETRRETLNTLIVARNLERVADHATNIAEDVIFWVQGADVRHHATEQP
jgi:phosphate transport system protein